MSDFSLSLSSKIVDKSIIANISIENMSDKLCYIKKDTVMLDGFKNNKFVITTEDNQSAIYIGRIAKYYPETVSLNPHDVLSNQLNLNLAYDIPQANTYSITYKTYISCCSDSAGKDCSTAELLEAASLLGVTNNDYE